MTHKNIKFLAAIIMGAMLLTGCGKDNETLIGKWYNTAQSYEITIDGQQNIPEGYISMEFTDSKVWISDSRIDCLAEWHNYTLSKESGKQILEIKGGCFGERYVIEELTNNKLVLINEHPNIDWDYKYIMKRYE